MPQPELLTLIRHFEGLRLRSYRDPVGVLTIGYGTTGPDVKPGAVWSKMQCEQRMQDDAAMFERGVRRLCPSITGVRLAAIADFAYNLGLGRLKRSTLRKRILAGDHERAAVELARWVYGGGRKLRGLVRRRAAEVALYQSGGRDG